MWIVFHAIFWDGNAANKEDIIDSLLSPGKMMPGDIITNQLRFSDDKLWVGGCTCTVYRSNAITAPAPR